MFNDTKFDSVLSALIEPLKKIVENAITKTNESINSKLDKKDILTSANIDPTNKYQVFSAEVMLKVFEEFFLMISLRELAEDKLTEYTENPIEANYYSAKAVNEMYRSIMNGIEEVSALIGGAEE